MEQLTEILHQATAAISNGYFLLPIHGAHPVYRERVYCYELYHQMRLRWPDGSPYRLNGEVDKSAHPCFQQMDAGRPKPDLLVHQPGSGEYNHAVIEVKSVAGEDIQKDLETLSLFRNDFGYQRAIYLIYGPDGRVARVRPSPTVFRIWRLSRCGCIWRRAPRRPIYSL
ncbi:MAG: hypothetical protein ABSH01_01040 [Terriglobia bacterium]